MYERLLIIYHLSFFYKWGSAGVELENMKKVTENEQFLLDE